MRLTNYIKTTRFKTTIWYSSIFLLLEIFIGVVIYFYVQTSMSKHLDISLQKQVDLVYHFVSESVVDLNEFKSDSIYSTSDELVYDLIFEAVAFNPTNTFIQVRYKDKVVFKTANLAQSEINISPSNRDEIELFTFSDSLLSKHPIRAAYLNKNGYEIITAFPIYLINETLASLTDLYIIIAPIFFLLSLAGGAIISFRALHRMDRIIKKTNEITTQNLNEIIEGGDFDDEYGRLVKTMNKMVQRIKTSIDYMNQFSIAAAHELKTPLTILRGEIELALRSEKTPEEYKNVLQSNYEETLRLIKIIEQLFLLTRLDNSMIKIEKDNVELKPLMENVIKAFSPIIKTKNISLNLIYELDDEFVVFVDPNLFRQVLVNLIDNALKYGKENNDVTIRCSKSNEEKAVIIFSNISEPIPQEVLSRLFERFYRTESSRNRNLGGLGLGLSLVKSIIDLHQGTYFIDSSSEGKFTFTLNI